MLPHFILTGDEVGLLKCIEFPSSSSNPSHASKKLKSHLKQETLSTPQVHVFGKVDRLAGIACMSYSYEYDTEKGGESVSLVNMKQVAIARKNGVVELLELDCEVDTSVAVDQDNEEETKTQNKKKWSLNPIFGSQLQLALGNVKSQVDETFIGICVVNDIFMACTSHGQLFFTRKQNDSVLVRRFDLGQTDLSVASWNTNSSQPYILATGGKERDLCVWNLEPLISSMESQEPTTLTPIWQAKNVKNNYLDLRVPVWITALKWLPEETTSHEDKDSSSPLPHARLVTGTGYGQVRLYHPRKQRRPTFDGKVFENPIKCIQPLSSPTDSHHVVVSNTLGEMKTIDTSPVKASTDKNGLVTPATAGAYRGIAGAVTCLGNTNEHIVTVGVDRFLRLFEMSGKRRIFEKVYLKQRLTAVLVSEDESARKNSSDEIEEDVADDESHIEEEDDERDIDELLEDMETVNDTKDRKKKRKSPSS